MTLALVSYFRSPVVRALHQHRKGLGSISAKGPIVDEFFSTLSDLIFDACMRFYDGTFSLQNFIFDCLTLKFELLFVFLLKEKSLQPHYAVLPDQTEFDKSQTYISQDDIEIVSQRGVSKFK